MEHPFKMSPRNLIGYRIECRMVNSIAHAESKEMIGK